MKKRGKIIQKHLEELRKELLITRVKEEKYRD